MNGEERTGMNGLIYNTHFLRFSRVAELDADQFFFDPTRPDPHFGADK